MGDRTEIAWTDATWNPLRGCSRVSEGCRFCYAERVAARFSGPGMPYEGLATMRPVGAANDEGARAQAPRWTGDVRLVEEHLADPLRWRKPRRIFVNSMSDLFHERVPDAWIDRIFAVMALAPRHTFQVLTKRPERMRTYMVARATPGMSRAHMGIALGAHPCDLPPPPSGGAWNIPYGWPLPNVWLGVSVEDQRTADERIPLLLQTPAAVRFVSYEPALGPVSFGRWMPPGRVTGACSCGTYTSHPRLGCYGYCQDPTGASCDAFPCPGCGRRHTWSGSHHGNGRSNGQPLAWIIVGGESGPGARPFDVEWARSTVKACKAAGVACFVKQFGARPVCDHAWWDAHEPELDRLMDLTRRCADGDRMVLPLLDRKGANPDEWPEDLRVREFPRVVAGAVRS